jgi:hypothetical protein
MSTHLITDPTATTDPTVSSPDAPGSAPTAATTGVTGPAGRAWAVLSTALTDEAALIADRDDLLVTIAPGAGHGAPACLLTTQAMIEIDGAHLAPVTPAAARPDDPADRGRYATTWGLLVHECAHARHSLWIPPADTPPAAVAAAELLEESRIEAAQIRVRPDDRHWLRASARALILADTLTPPHPDSSPDTPGAAADDTDGSGSTEGAERGGVGDRPLPLGWTRQAAAQAAGLLLARRDGGILTPAETAPVQAAVEAVLGADTLAALQEIWKAAHTTAPDDGAAMIELGRRWCTALGTDTNPATGTDTGAGAVPGSTSATTPTDPATTTTAAASTTTTAAASGAVPSAVLAAALDTAVAEALSAVTAHVAAEPIPADPSTAARRAAEDTEKEAAATAARAARRVFTDSTPAGTARGVPGTRTPTPAEKAAARRIGRSLSTAGVRDRVATRRPSLLPPGRLRMRGALVADAQRAAGALPTAEPFVRTVRAVVPAPPLRLGIACDVSGSMIPYTEPVASAAWILAHATAHTRVPAVTATVTFGKNVRAITHPGVLPALVSEFTARDDDERVDTAIDALDAALGLTRPGAARLLIIVSDGYFRPARRTGGQTRTDRLRAAGCGVLWLAPRGAAPFDRVQVLELADPAGTAQAIARAATAALRTATR